MSCNGALSDVSDRSAEIYPETVLSGNLRFKPVKNYAAINAQRGIIYNKQSTIASVFYIFFQCELDRPASLCVFFPCLTVSRFALYVIPKKLF